MVESIFRTDPTFSFQPSSSVKFKVYVPIPDTSSKPSISRQLFNVVSIGSSSIFSVLLPEVSPSSACPWIQLSTCKVQVSSLSSFFSGSSVSSICAPSLLSAISPASPNVPASATAITFASSLWRSSCTLTPWSVSSYSEIGVISPLQQSRLYGTPSPSNVTLTDTASSSVLLKK